MPLPVNGGKGGHAEEIRIDFTKELKEDVVLYEEYAVIAKFIILFEVEEERNHALTNRNWFVNTHAIYIQPWMPHFDPTPLAGYSEPVWICLYNLLLEYWSEELWEKIGRTLGTLLETDFDDEEDICKSTQMRIVVVKSIPESITLVSECGEWIQKVEIEKNLVRCPRCGRKFHGEKECKMYVRKARNVPRKPTQTWRRKLEERKKMVESQGKEKNKEDEQTHMKERKESEILLMVDEGDKENRMDNIEIAIEKDGEMMGKENNFESIKVNINGSRNNAEEDCRGTSSREKGLSDTKFDYKRGSNDEPFQTDELDNIDPRCISQSANVLLGKAKGVRGKRSNKQKKRTEQKRKE
ncbi:hypothetical protein SUGI_0413700 [Cryptomeria japonica]|nr:hypothetical protein SUGI_0413700 [Cryptomeria japonica]